MRLVHLADLHLGFRQFDRVDALGRNYRELDVAASCRAAISQVIELAPDLMIIAGDVMHMVRPPNPVVIEAFAEFKRLMDALPRLAVVMVAGNHDYPRSEGTGCILGLFTQLGIHVVDREAQRITFPELGLSVLAVPDTPMVGRPQLTPDPDARFNVMVMHGEVQGMKGLRHEQALNSYLPADMSLPSWDYIGLGHYHVCQELAPNMWYAGAIDYTSTNPWGELEDEKMLGVCGKGFIERDLVAGRHTFHPLPLSRDHIDLTVDATSMDAKELSRVLGELLDDAHPDQAIARVVVTDCSLDVQRQVDAKMIREFKGRALNLQIKYKRPEVRRYESPATIPSVRRAAPLEDMLSAVMKRRQESGAMAPDLSIDAIAALSAGYLRRADDLAERSGTPATVAA